MKKRLFFLFFFRSGIFGLQGQILDPVSWSASAEKTETPGVYRLRAQATIPSPWHIYALTLPQGGPFPTELVFSLGGYELQGETGEPAPQSFFDPNFQMEIKWHSGQPVFTQQIRITDAPMDAITAEVTYQACDDQQCLPPETRVLTFRLPQGEAFLPAPASEKADPAKAIVPATDLSDPDRPTSEQKPRAAQSSEPPADKATLEAIPDMSPDDAPEDAPKADTQRIGGADGATAIWVSAEDGNTASQQDDAASGLWGTFLFAFVAGLLALFTPCVFPMIPMTVSFFIKRYSDRRKGIRDTMLYGLSIVAIYLILGVGVSAAFGAAALYELSTDPWFNLFFFLLLVVFAASFFGAFELTLPSSWVNKMDRKSDKAGLAGIFFMAFTLALVSFSCTGPFVGTILVEAAAKGDFWGPVIGMAGFSIALALPFTLFALFPGWLSGLPKSGGWLNSVKVVLGFVELAFALKFLSNTDMVMNWGLLPREVFIALWVTIFALLGFYLLGKIRLPHDSPLETVSVPRLFLALLSLSFAVYLVPGIWGAPVKIISAFAPPTTYSESASATGGKNESLKVLNTEFMALEQGDYLPWPAAGPQGIPVFTDLQEATVYARAKNRPLLLDFTGKTCVNCRKMEADVWSDARVKALLSDRFVVVELYADSRERLPEDQQFVATDGKRIRTVGQKWTQYQIERFGRNSQPLYVITDPQDRVLAPVRAYDTDVQAYIAWLEEALAAFRAGQEDPSHP